MGDSFKDHYRSDLHVRKSMYKRLELDWPESLSLHSGEHWSQTKECALFVHIIGTIIETKWIEAQPEQHSHSCDIGISNWAKSHQSVFTWKCHFKRREQTLREEAMKMEQSDSRKDQANLSTAAIIWKDKISRDCKFLISSWAIPECYQKINKDKPPVASFVPQTKAPTFLVPCTLPEALLLKASQHPQPGSFCHHFLS